VLVADTGTNPPAKRLKSIPTQEDSMETEKTLRDLFHDTLKDIYFAEKKILGALPKMAKAAQSE
jgi:hypothetical protein